METQSSCGENPDPNIKRDARKCARDLFLADATSGWGVWSFYRKNHNPIESELYDQNGNSIIMWRKLPTLILNVAIERRPGSSSAGVTRG